MEDLLYITWDEKHDIGVPEIDEQHKAIVNAINSLYFFIKYGNEEELLHPTLKYLETYIDIHFNTEVRLLSRTNYPAIGEHTSIRKELLAKIKKASDDISKKSDMDELLIFLREWWFTHINKEHKKYTPYILKLSVTN